MWNIVTSETKGRSHKLRDMPCQDKTCTYKDDNVSIIALADGAGSAALSHYGAECAVKRVCKYLSTEFDSLYNAKTAMDAKQTIVGEVLCALEAEGKKHGCSMKELACTLLFVAVSDERFLIGHIGDGVICYTEKDEVFVASEPDNGEYANITYFVTSLGAEKRMRLIKGVLEGVDGFALMSDGTSASFYNHRTNKMSSGAASLIKLCRDLPNKYMAANLQVSMDNVIAARTHDDCSVAIMARSEGTDFCSLRENIKYDLLGIKPDKKAGKRVEFYESVIKYLAEPKTPLQISRQTHIRQKYVKRRMRKLSEAGLVTVKGNKFYKE